MSRGPKSLSGRTTLKTHTLSTRHHTGTLAKQDSGSGADQGGSSKSSSDRGARGKSGGSNRGDANDGVKDT
jgi:hypothetical protein